VRGIWGGKVQDIDYLKKEIREQQIDAKEQQIAISKLQIDQQNWKRSSQPLRMIWTGLGES